MYLINCIGRTLAAAILCLVVSGGSATAQIMEDPALPSARTEREVFSITNPRTDDDAINAMLNFEFERAEALFRARDKADPGSPEGVFGLGLTMWWRVIAGDGGTVRETEDLLETAMKRSRNFADRPGKRAEALYYSGRSQSLLSAVYLVENSLLKAYRASQRAKGYLNKCMDADPNYHDGQIGLGLYHYYADALPKFFKYVGWILGIKGDSELGLTELRHVAMHGPKTRGEAAYFLGNVYNNFERAPNSALDLLKWLVQAYPNNHVFFLEEQNSLESLGYYEEVEANLRRVMDGQFKHVNGPRLLLGRNLYRQARYQEGAELLEVAVKGRINRDDPAMPWFYYFAGRCRELMGDQQRAEQHYKAAEGFSTGGNVVNLAEDRRNNPEKPDDRRLRVARGLTRRTGTAIEAAEAWASIVNDINAERFDADWETDVDQMRFRHALTLEEGGEYDRAVAVYRTCGGTVRTRAQLGAARGFWRSGKINEATALLDKLSNDQEFDGRHSARRLRGMLDRPGCDDAPFTGTKRDFLYRDSEAWLVDVVIQDGSGSRCFPMTFQNGAWHASVAVADSAVHYYYRINRRSKEPDPLVKWVKGEGNETWSTGESVAVSALDGSGRRGG